MRPASVSVWRMPWVAIMLMIAAAQGGGTIPADAASRLRAPRTLSADPASLCEAAIRRAEQRFDTPPALLTAISIVETGRPDRGRERAWPWSVDVNGIGSVFPTRDAALAFTRAALTAGARSIDVGCMQVNLEQHPDAFASLEDAFDPPRNVTYAARFLVSLAEPARTALPLWAVAVGFYHSQTPAIAGPYRARVLALHRALAPLSADAIAMPGGLSPRAAPTLADQVRTAWAATMDTPAAP